MEDQTNDIQSTIVAALSTLTSDQLSSLALALSSTFHRHHLRLASLLSSPTLFTHTLNHLYSLCLPQKSILIARYLLSFLQLLIPYFPPSVFSTLPSNANRIRLCELDSVFLLLFLCEVRQHHPRVLEISPGCWHGVLVGYWSDTMLNTSRLTVSLFDVLGAFIDIVVKCRRFVSMKGCASEFTGREVAASVAAVVALPSVNVKKGDSKGVECVICQEEMREGRDVCQLPCQHMFHWICVLPWFRKTNTCPCCRFRLPTDDVFVEIDRLWDFIAKFGR